MRRQGLNLGPPDPEFEVLTARPHMPPHIFVKAFHFNNLINGMKMIDFKDEILLGLVWPLCIFVGISKFINSMKSGIRGKL